MMGQPILAVNLSSNNIFVSFLFIITLVAVDD
jgi:hypothetical protein